ncbi:MAG: ATP-binding cassette domain-containing protein [Bacteroidota bacterium]
MIELSDLRRDFGSKAVLRGVGATLLPGRVYGIVGENGAGKTTLFRCLAGLITCEGDIHDPHNQLATKLGFLQTENYFLPKLTGREYLRLLCQARSVPVPPLDAQNLFDLPLDDYAETYSTGMKKKLALLGVLLQGNEVFILDEPFNGVDIQSNLLITEIIRELRRRGKVVLISSHVFTTLRAVCDELFLLREGRFAEHVLPEEYGRLEQDMIAVTVGDRVRQLAL